MDMATLAIVIIVIIGVVLWPFFRYPRKDRDPRGYSGGHYTGGDVEGTHSRGSGDVGGRDIDYSHSHGDIGSHDGWGGGDDGGGGGDGGGDGGGGE